MLVRIGESEEEPRFVNVRLVIVVIIKSKVSFDMHQKKCSACVLNLLLEYHWVGWPTTGAQRYGRMKKDKKTNEENPQRS